MSEPIVSIACACVTKHWHTGDTGVFIVLDGAGYASYGIRKPGALYIDQVVTFPVADGLPEAARDAIIEHGGDPTDALVISRNILH